METFTIVMTVLMAISALGQLAISIAMLSKSKRRAITNWMAWRFDFFCLIFLLAFSSYGILVFAFKEDPQKMDYYNMAASLGGLAMAYATMLCMYLVRYTHRIETRLNYVEYYLRHSSWTSEDEEDDPRDCNGGGNE